MPEPHTTIYTNPESGEQYEMSTDAVTFWAPHIGKWLVVHIVNGSLCINPNDGPYDASQFGPYIEPALPAFSDDLESRVAYARWHPGNGTYTVIGDPLR